MLKNPRDVAALNFFRATELHGAVIAGQMARRTSDPQLILNLTQCSAEQILHSARLGELIIRQGGSPAPVRATYQDLLAGFTGAPVTIIEILVMMQTVERFMTAHFVRSDRTWIQSWLDQHSRKYRAEVSDVTRRYASAEMRIARLPEGNRSSPLDNLGKPERVPVREPDAAV